MTDAKPQLPLGMRNVLTEWELEYTEFDDERAEVVREIRQRLRDAPDPEAVRALVEAAKAVDATTANFFPAELGEAGRALRAALEPFNRRCRTCDGPYPCSDPDCPEQTVEPFQREAK